MKYGTEKTTIQKFRDGIPELTLKHSRVRVKVLNQEEVMTEFSEFMEDLERWRKQGLLTWDKDDSSTRPAFTLEFNNKKDAYYIIKSYTIIN